jgi:hypothetical protein
MIAPASLVDEAAYLLPVQSAASPAQTEAKSTGVEVRPASLPAAVFLTWAV